HLDGRIDLVFVDADHRDEPQFADFRAVRPYCHDATLYLFHDIYICNTAPSFRRIAAELPNHDSFVLSRTASGIGAAVPKSETKLRRMIEAFTDPFCPIAW
ncbi:MAG: class I SAM-dependent methyltransferase, partial [Tagaea sp.]|nr:class I SAM-dependent methyltransferase [Tagaea sp.]